MASAGHGGSASKLFFRSFSIVSSQRARSFYAIGRPRHERIFLRDPASTEIGHDARPPWPSKIISSSSAAVSPLPSSDPSSPPCASRSSSFRPFLSLKRPPTSSFPLHQASGCYTSCYTSCLLFFLLLTLSSSSSKTKNQKNGKKTQAPPRTPSTRRGSSTRTRSRRSPRRSSRAPRTAARRTRPRLLWRSAT